MDKHFEMLEATRKNIMEVMDSCTTEQLYIIPDSFNNHILWNAAHLLATQQILWYRATNTPVRLDEGFIEKYAKGTTPSSVPDPEAVRFVKNNLLSSIDQAREDYLNRIFGAYRSVTTSYGITLNTLEDAIYFVNIHEGLHFGQIKMLKKLVDQM